MVVLKAAVTWKACGGTQAVPPAVKITVTGCHRAEHLTSREDRARLYASFLSH